MLHLQNLCFAYENTLFDFSIEVPTGSFVAIIGPSGAGKSTLLDLVAGFATSVSGSLSFDGVDLTNTHPSKRPVSVVFQENNLFTHLDVTTNVGLGLSPSLKLDTSDHKKITDALARVGLDGYHKRLPGELSGGQRQRVALARALVRDKPCLLLDEPFAALGPALRQQMLELVKDLQREQNLTVLLVSHQPADAKSVASHTAFLNNGRIEIFAPTAEFFAITDNEDLARYQGNS